MDYFNKEHTNKVEILYRILERDDACTYVLREREHVIDQATKEYVPLFYLEEGTPDSP